MTPPAPLPGPAFNPDDDPYLARRVREQEEERLRQTKALNDLIGQDAAGDPAAARAASAARALARARAARARPQQPQTGEEEG